MLRTTWKMKSDFIHISMSLSIFFSFMLSFYQKWYLMMCLKLPSERWLVSDINNLISSIFFSVRCLCILRSFFKFSLHRSSVLSSIRFMRTRAGAPSCSLFGILWMCKIFIMRQWSGSFQHSKYLFLQPFLHHPTCCFSCDACTVMPFLQFERNYHRTKACWNFHKIIIIHCVKTWMTLILCCQHYLCNSMPCRLLESRCNVIWLFISLFAQFFFGACFPFILLPKKVRAKNGSIFQMSSI